MGTKNKQDNVIIYEDAVKGFSTDNAKEDKAVNTNKPPQKRSTKASANNDTKEKTNKTQNDNVKNATKSKPQGERKATKVEEKSKKQKQPVVINEESLKTIDNFSEYEYLAVSQSFGMTAMIAEAKSNAIYKEAFYLIEPSENNEKQFTDAKFTLVQSFINVVINSFIIGFLVYFLSSTLMLLLIKKKDIQVDDFKKIFKNSIICGLVSLCYGIIVAFVMMFISIYAGHWFVNRESVLYIKLIITSSLIFLSYLLSLLLYCYKTKSFKISLLRASKKLIWLAFYLAFVTMLQLVFSGMFIIASAVIARMLLVYLLELASNERQQRERNIKQ